MQTDNTFIPDKDIEFMETRILRHEALIVQENIHHNEVMGGAGGTVSERSGSERTDTVVFAEPVEIDTE